MSTTIIAESCADSDLHPAVRELIADTLSLWFGSREPDPDIRETITAEALAGMLHRVATRAFSTGRADSEPNVADIVRETDTEDALWQIDALCNAASALARDRDFEIDPDSIHRLLIIMQSIVHRLLPEPGGSDEP